MLFITINAFIIFDDRNYIMGSTLASILVIFGLRAIWEYENIDFR